VIVIRQITKMWEIQDGKRYFLMQSIGGTIKTSICKATVTYDPPQAPGSIIDKANIVFALESGDASPGPANCFYIAELDD
jgi:hypothetical protein